MTESAENVDALRKILDSYPAGMAEALRVLRQLGVNPAELAGAEQLHREHLNRLAARTLSQLDG